ncbi:hypothetical protein ACFV4N_08265 [Actinosynnema sp. NPDC059797]
MRSRENAAILPGAALRTDDPAEATLDEPEQRTRAFRSDWATTLKPPCGRTGPGAALRPDPQRSGAPQPRHHIMAAAITPLPADLGYSSNHDYRYRQPRDVAL